jgi:hypothetical protein
MPGAAKIYLVLQVKSFPMLYTIYLWWTKASIKQELPNHKYAQRQVNEQQIQDKAGVTMLKNPITY